ncbi:hypothetical protein Afil01_05690 [Actinorhabdospora filicis]|uniref:Magnesium transporter NIPA n=1 Tax=Actinorhabdospora filicis TaxID=1785913 RepID=A0A9W6SGW7_9ACTN|nr:DMT family transporter [Actinorhabdospora filicis]GLZ75762.1 hypothetical protein Afil01_05690 [Actinorhabdospora filicis]
MTWPILTALAGALLLAFGAALQEGAAVAAEGRARPLLALARRPRWLLGAGLSAAGVGLHLLALSAAPVTLIQPLGVSGLLFAVAAAAMLARRPVRPAEIAGALLVTAGLIALVLSLPHRTSAAPTLDARAALGLAAVAAAAVLTGLLLAGRLTPTWRALTLATAAGISFGAVSAFARVLATAARGDATALLHWHTAVAVALAALGGIALQHAYRSGRFSLAFAALLLADPIAAAAIGLAVLNEPPPAAGAWWLVLAAAVIAPGVTLLARTRHPRTEGAPHVAAGH